VFRVRERGRRGLRRNVERACGGGHVERNCGEDAREGI